MPPVFLNLSFSNQGKMATSYLSILSCPSHPYQRGCASSLKDPAKVLRLMVIVLCLGYLIISQLLPRSD